MTIATGCKTAAAVLLAVVTLGLGACSPTNNVVSNVAKAAFENRLAEEQVVDAKIKAGILDRMISIDKMLALDLSVDVWKTRVMLTGTLSSTDLRNQVARATQQDARISEFYNEVQIITEDEQATRREWKEKAQSGAQKAAESFEDFWIETKISAQLIGAEGVNSVNFRWRSVSGTVYLLGEAGSAKELNAVVTIIKNTKGVKALKSFAPVRG
jgi:osmotically-inducible protein OsmY